MLVGGKSVSKQWIVFRKLQQKCLKTWDMTTEFTSCKETFSDVI